MTGEPNKVATVQVGCRVIDVRDPTQNAVISVSILYPTSAPSRLEPFGPFTMELAMNAPVTCDDAGLVVVSHGTGSTPWLHRDLAAHLARAGFVVALVQHPGNHRGDNSLAYSPVNMQNRPRHLRLVVDAILSDESVAAHVSHRGVAVIGHSLGGYSALAVAGGQPASTPHDGPEVPQGPFDVEHDQRVKALVLLAPATVWFHADNALAAVTQPVLMRVGANDPHAGTFHGDIVERGLPDPSKLDYKVVPNAGHFAFVSRYPDELTSPAIPPSQDPPGFDRASYLPLLFAEVTQFLQTHL